MNKSSHLLITGEILSKYTELNKRQRILVMAGSILPDILVHTYVRGHTWPKRSFQTFQRIRAYQYRSRSHAYYFIQYGCVLHYIEDFFTWPHNSTYKGTLKDHVKYETRLHQYLAEGKSRAEESCHMHVQTAEQLISQLENLHQEYMQKAPGMMTDECYITKAAGMAVEYLLVTRKERQWCIPFYETEGYPVYSHFII